jgi:pimeloyl-ACP methyl ester carboxylesterase
MPGPWPASFMHDEAWVALPEVVAALGVRDGFLVGHSDGASIALIHAAKGAAGWDAGGPGGGDSGSGRSRDRGSRGSPGSPRGPGASGNPGGPGNPGRVRDLGGPGGWLRGMALEAPHIFVEPEAIDSIGKLPGLYRQPDLWQRLVRYHGANTESSFESWVEIWLRPEFRSWSIDELLPRVRCPVLAIQGESDPYGTLAQLQAVAAGCGGPTETLLLPGCGHTPHRQQRAATLEAMTGFLRRLL